MTELTDGQIVALIQRDTGVLMRLRESTLLDLWLLKARRDPQFKPIREIVQRQNSFENQSSTHTSAILQNV